MSTHLERPCLRRGLAAATDERDRRSILVWDERRFSGQIERLTQTEFNCVQLFDGHRTLSEIQAEAGGLLGGQVVPLELFANLARRFDEALFLEGPRFRAQLGALSVRGPVHTEPYSPDELRRLFEQFFTGRGGPGLPQRQAPDDRLRAALLPHMDYERGNVTYAHGFKELVEHTAAQLFVIVGTSHYSGDRFTLTRKDFKTPLGTVRTDQSFIDRLVAHYGDGLFDDEVTHYREHSIELEVALLQYLYEGQRPIRLVPLLAGTFHDCIEEGVPPQTRADVGRMVEALRRAEAETPEPICYLISGDLAHLGPKFGDRRPVNQPLLTHSREQDQAILRQAEAADPAEYFRVVAGEGDRRRICGLPPTYTVLAAARPRRGKVLHYQQYVDPGGQESVSFASVAFYR